MKFIDILFGSVKWLALAVTGIISGWIWFDAHFDSKVQASENRVMERVHLMRSADMEVIKSIKSDTRLLKMKLLGVKDEERNQETN